MKRIKNENDGKKKLTRHSVKWDSAKRDSAKREDTQENSLDKIFRIGFRFSLFGMIVPAIQRKATISIYR